MKSRLFTDTQGLDAPAPLARGQIAVCLRMSREAYAHALRRAAALGLTSGAYLQRLVERDLSAAEETPPAD